MKTKNLKYRLRFEKRALDANGDPLGAWQSAFVQWAEIDYKRGSESAMTNRLIGKQPVTIEIRDTCESRAVTDRFRAVVVSSGMRKGEVFNVRAVAPSRDPGFINIVAESGVADG